MPRRVATILLLLLTAACAQAARSGEMVYHPDSAQVALVPEDLKSSLTVETVVGGEPTNPMWTSEVGNAEFRSALEVSLNGYGLLAYDETSPYGLAANLISVEQPLLGFDMTVTSTADYLVTRRDDGSEVFHETIVTPFTADFSSSFMAVERLRLANEGAIRVNIQQFIERYLATVDGT